MNPNWLNIPAELRALNQWVVCYDDKKPRVPLTGALADPSDSTTWGTFEQACNAGFPHIGFVFTHKYTCIDLDDPTTIKVKGQEIPNPNEAEVERLKALHAYISEGFDSYSEVSTRGRGAHIVIEGEIPANVQRDKVELYGRNHFVIMTGNVLNPSPIRNYQTQLSNMASQMVSSANIAELEELDATESDDVIIARASAAKNGTKFDALWTGCLDGFPSQSEADMALFEMLCFYSKSNEQCRRLFRLSALGQRDKATKNNTYLDRTLAKVRGRQQAEALPLVDFSALLAPPPVVIPPPPPTPLIFTPSPVPPPPPPSSVKPPIGILGEMCDYIYLAAKHPVHEVSIVSSLTCFAGIIGRQFNISNTGMNLYGIVLGKTGVGKEGGSEGVDSLIQHITEHFPDAREVIGPSAFASGQSVIKMLETKMCCVAMLGEMGLMLQQLCHPNAAPHAIQLRRALLDLFTKSGKNRYLQQSVYADTTKNTAIVRAPCLSFFGDATPETFFKALGMSHVAEGFLSRMFVLPYYGPRLPSNPRAFHAPPSSLVIRLAEIFKSTTAMRLGNSFVDVPLDHYAQLLLDEYDRHCDDLINNGTDEVIRQLWNRAHLKVLKLCGLVAVGCHIHNPVVTAEIAQWAIDTVNFEVGAMVAQFTSGDIGEGDHQREAEIVKAMRRYREITPKQRGDYNTPEALREMPALVPYAFLKKFLFTKAAFAGAKREASAALAAALADMVKGGTLIEIGKEESFKKWQVRTLVYMEAIS